MARTGMTRWGARCAGALLVTSLMTGCSSFGGDDDAKSSAPGTASTAVAGAGEAGLDLDHLPKPIATQTFKGTGTVKNVKVELVQLRNRGKVTQLVFALTPDLQTDKTLSVYEAFGHRSPSIAAFDLVGLKKYEAIDAGYPALGSDPVYTKLTSGTTTYYWAFVPTPAAEKVDVQFHESMPMFENVAVPK